MSRDKAAWLLPAAHIAALLPMAWIAGDFALDRLTANPIREIQLRTGITTLVLLVLTIACHPLYRVSGFKPALLLRRRMGLYAFMYACIHLLNFIGLDYGFNLALIRADIAEKRFIFAGLAAFVILLALAVTSTSGWKQRLGRNWDRLHRLVYLAAILGVLHFTWQTKAKSDLLVPFVYAAIVLLLLIMRIPRIGRGRPNRQ